MTWQDVWMTRITYGCDDPSASNYDASADVAECCTYPDAPLAPPPHVLVDLLHEEGKVVGALLFRPKVVVDHAFERLPNRIVIWDRSADIGVSSRR